MCGERIESRESWPARKPGRPFAALHVNEPSQRHSQGDIIRGTVQGEAQLQGTKADGRGFHCSPVFTFLAITAEYGGDQKGTGLLIV